MISVETYNFLYFPLFKNFTKPLSLKYWSCCLILSLIKLFSGCFNFNSFSKAYIWFKENSAVFIFSIQAMISSSQPRDSIFVFFKDFIFAYLFIISFESVSIWSFIINIFPASGIFRKCFLYFLTQNPICSFYRRNLL